MHNFRIWISLNNYGHFSNATWTNLWHLQEVSKSCGSVCVCLVYPNFNEQDCMVLYESMPRRIDIVLKSKGYWTNYLRFYMQLEQNWLYVNNFSFDHATYFLTINVLWYFAYMWDSMYQDLGGGVLELRLSTFICVIGVNIHTCILWTLQ